MSERVTAPSLSKDDARFEQRLRPSRFDEFVGQNTLKDNLSVFIEAALKRGEPLDHCLFYGPPGLGKTTLAHIIAVEMGTELVATSGPVIERPYDLTGILTSLRASSGGRRRSSVCRWTTGARSRSPGARGGRPGSRTACFGACATSPR